MDKPAQTKQFIHIITILAVVLVAGVARLRAATLLPIDYDEDDYLRAAQLYAAIIKTGSWKDFANVEFNPEHPSLGKLVYGVGIASLPPEPLIPERSVTDPAAEALPQALLGRARTISAILGTLEVLLLACLDPLAGLFLALHTFTIKFTSHALIEALPAFSSAILVMAYERSRIYAGWARNSWLVLSAIALGITVASKYAYAVAGIAILVHWMYSQRDGPAHGRRFRWSVVREAILWIVLAMAVFLAADPYLWQGPVERLLDSVHYHIDFSQGYLVRLMHFPFYMPLAWLFQWVPWHPDIFPVGIDPFVAALAVLGFFPLCRKNSLYAIWLVTGLIFLFIWPTKWPQYILIITFPWSLAAAQGFRQALDPAFRLRLHTIYRKIIHPGAANPIQLHKG